MTGRGKQSANSDGSAFRRIGARVFAGFLAATMMLTGVEVSVAKPDDRTLTLYHTHTKERITVTFKRNGTYDRNGLRQLNHFLRDWRNDKPTNMDPMLFDIVWEVYRQVGGREPIHIVSSYRSPETNGMLRRRSKGVAKNSLHMQGKAMDFFIPGVQLAKLRAAGLRLQSGGVGFYPTSGSPFVHLDTGSVRHWPRMTREQLVAVFPRGGTIHVPSDGKPLPGYQEALAAYKARKATGNVAVASFVPDADEEEDVPAVPATRPNRAAAAAPITLASAGPADQEVADDVMTAMAGNAPRAVAVAAYADVTPPMPRIAPRPAAKEGPIAAVIAEADTVRLPPAPIPEPAVALAALDTNSGNFAPDFDFGGPQDWASPAVPAALAEAMAARDTIRRNASLPIAPTAVVATVGLSRPIRAAAITTAVLRGGQTSADTPAVLAFAAPDQGRQPVTPRKAVMTTAGVPLPSISPRHNRAAPATRSIVPAPRMVAPPLTMTALDTQGLRLWIGTASTRQKGYALLTMPDFARTPGIMDKPSVAFGDGFSQTAAPLRTDRFFGGLTEQPNLVDLTLDPVVASIR